MIPVKCSHCQKSYKPVQDEFAGRKVTCQACKTVFVIAGPGVASPRPAAQTLAPQAKPAAVPPKPVAAPQPAASPPTKPAPARVPTAPPKPAADAPPPKPIPAPAPTTVDFRCPQCDTDVQMPLAMAGKNAPCPECRRIVRVPLPTKKQPTDWRNVNTGGPSMAKRQSDSELAGVWSSGTAEKVTGGELIRAGVIKEKKEPWTRWQKIRAGLVLVLVAGLLFGGFVGARTFWVRGQEEKALRKALDAVEDKNTPLDALAAAEIHRGAGEFYRRAGDQSTLARVQFQKAVQRLMADRASDGLPDRDAMLIDLAVGQAGLILDPEQFLKVKQRVLAQKQQDQTIEDIKQTLGLIRSAEARMETLRQVTRILLAQKQEDRATELAAPGILGEGQIEGLAVIGLERFRAGQTSEANILADLALDTAKEDRLAAKKKEKSKKVAAPSLVALCILLKKPADKLAILHNEADPWAERMGQAAALGWQKNFDGARGEMQNLQPLDQWRVLAVIAAAGLEQQPPVTGPAEELAKWLDAGALAKMAEDEGKLDKEMSKPHPSWLLSRLVHLAAKADPTPEELAKRLADAIPDPALHARARLAVLRARLQRSNAPAPDDWANDVDTQTTVYPLAREALARHNTRWTGASAALKAVEGWTPETLRPFGYIGVALGIQDARQ